MEIEHLKILEKQLESTLSSLRPQMDKMNQFASKLAPKGSRKCILNDKIITASLIGDNNIIIEFSSPEEGLNFYNSLKLSE